MNILINDYKYKKGKLTFSGFSTFAVMLHICLFFLVFLIYGCGGGGGGGITPGDINDGIFSGQARAYTGSYSKGTIISYVDVDGRNRAVYGVQGQVQFMVDPTTSFYTVKQLVSANHGTIEAQIPALGQYLVSVEPGKEARFIEKIDIALDIKYKAPHFLIDVSSAVVDLTDLIGPDGELPAMPNLSARVGEKTYLYVLDDYVNSSGLSPSHGVSVDNVASKGLGSTGQQINIFRDKNTNIMPFDIAAAADILYKDITFNNTGRVVINFSQQGATHDEDGNPFDLATYSQNQEHFLEYKCAILDQLRRKSSDVFERTVFVISAGNGVGNTGTQGLDLAETINKLKTKYPELFSPSGPHIVIVGGLDANGQLDKGFNYSSEPGHMVYARARDVEVDASGNTLSGTSFAAPQVANLIAKLLKNNPNRTMTEIMKAFYEASFANNWILPSPESVQAKIETQSDTYTLLITLKGTGDGTVSVSPTPISMTSEVTVSRYIFSRGTRITLVATPGQDSIFKKWTGDKGGTSNTLTFTLDSSKSITAIFEKNPAGLISGKWSGTYTFENTGGFGYIYYNHGSISMDVSSTDGRTFSGTAFANGFMLRWDDGRIAGTTSSNGTVSGTIGESDGSECQIDGTFSFPIQETGTVINMRFTGKLDREGINAIFPRAGGGSHGSLEMKKQ